MKMPQHAFVKALPRHILSADRQHGHAMQNVSLGRFDTEERAAQEYDKGVQKLARDGRPLNFVSGHPLHVGSYPQMPLATSTGMQAQ